MLDSLNPTLHTVFERLASEPGIIDLVLWFNDLTWGELAAGFVAVATWSLLTSPIEQALVHHGRRSTARLLLLAALLVRPRAPT